MARVEREAEGLSLRDYNVRVAEEYGKLYTRYMKERFLTRVPGVFLAGCRPSDFGRSRYAKEYDSLNEPLGRTDDADVFCRSQGSWFYDIWTMARIQQTIELTDRLIDSSTRRLWPIEDERSRTIYHSTFSHPWLRRVASPGRHRGHGGATRYGTNSVVIRLPWGHVGVAAANTDTVSTTRLAEVMMTAFYEATRETYEMNVDRPGQDIRSSPLLNPDPAYCAQACDRERRCRSWTYVPPGIQHPSVARCWLKDGIPNARRRSLLISGVKGRRY